MGDGAGDWANNENRRIGDMWTGLISYSAMDWAKTLLRISVFLLFLPGQPAMATPPLPGVTLEFADQATAKRSVDKIEIQTELRLQHHYGSGNVSVEIKVAEYKAGQADIPLSTFHREINALDNNAFPVTFSIPGTGGTYYITANADSVGEGNAGYSSATSTYLVVGADGKIKMITPAEFKHLENISSGILESDQKPGTETPEAVLSEPYVTVHSNVTYQAIDGTIKAVPYATVEIWEHDLFEDDYLATVVLDVDGKNVKTVNYGYDPFGTTEIYLVIKSENERYLFGTASADGQKITNYHFKTPVKRVSSGDNDISINYNITGAGKAMETWAAFNSVWDYTNKQLNVALPRLQVRYPGGKPDSAYFIRNFDLIVIGETYYNGPMVIGHEFGHALMWHLNNGWFPEGGGPHSLCPNNAVKVGLAWSEGYATAFGLISNHSTDGKFYWHNGGSGYSFETYSCAYKDLNTDEGRVAAALWDFLDEHDDCNSGDEKIGRNGFCDHNKNQRVSPAQALVDGVENQYQEDALKYWWYMHDSVLSAVQEPPAQDIYKYNWIAYKDVVINSFTWEQTSSQEGEVDCSPPYCIPTEAKWNASGRKCQLKLDGKLVSSSLSGVFYKTFAANSPPAYLTLSCEGWGPKQVETRPDPAHR